MPYEIPSEIEYKEKIVFGLTFQQILIILPFLFLVFVIFKSGSNIYVKGVGSAFSLSLASLFMFFGLGDKIKNFIIWKTTFTKLDYSIEDDYIISNNKKIAVLKILPINFAIKTDEEKETITLQFQKFLNAIDFPIQFLINTDTVNLNSYLDALKKRINKKYLSLFNKYKEYLKSTISKNSIMNRNFYLVIKEKTNIENQVEICLEKLENMNLKVEVLKKEELEELMSKFVSKENIENNVDYLKLGKLNRIICAYGYPRVVEAGFLDKLVSSIGNFDISLHIEPEHIETTMVMLNKELQKQRADLYASELKGILNPALEIKYKDTRKLLENLQKGYDKLFNVSLYINVKADNLEELNLLSKKVESELNSLLIIPQTANYRMLQGYKSVLPIANDELKVRRNITTYSLGAFFPFTSPFLQLDDSGVWFGLNKNKIPIIRDVFKLSNANGLILASSGSGKSYFAKLLIARHLLNNTKVMVVDPQAEYKGLVKQFNGQLVELSRNSKTMINPLDLMGHEYAEKRLSLMDFIQVLLGELTEPQKSFMDRAITQAYDEKGINDNPETWDNEPPILEDILEVLKRFEKRAITLEKTTIRSLINRLSMYVDGVFSFLNRHTNINFDNNFVCFDIGNLPKQVKPVMMFLVLDYVYMKMRSGLERKLLVIDEAWSLLSRTEDASYIFEIVKTCRKFNLGLLLINQEVEGMLNSEAGKSVLANSSYTLLMRQKPAVIRDVDEVFNLSKREKHVLLTAPVGEGLILIEDEHSEIKVVASEEEHRLITTNADEIIEQRKPKVREVKKPKKVEIKVDEEKGFYRHKDLSLPEIKYLLSKKYKESIQTSCFSNSKERYLLRPRFNESISHFFMIIDIYNYLKEKELNVKLFETKKPDIVFELDKKKIAIEVETGKIMKYAKNQLKTKLALLNEGDYDDWFFVVINKNFVSKYRKFGKVIDKRSMKNQLEKYLKNAQNCPK